MKNVMTRAWEIAKEGVNKFGGKAKEYFAQALVIAWAEVKKGVEKLEKTFAMLETLSGSRKHKTWVAKIKGTDATYKFDREFVDAYEEGSGYKEFKLYNGVYDVCDGGHRFYIQVVNGGINEITAGEVSEILA